MATINQFQIEEPIYFDFSFLAKGLVYFALAMVCLAPFSRDPMAVIVCGVMPWILVKIVDRPRMPAVIVYYLLWTWIQAAARLLLAANDGESLGDGFFGPNVARAFWYSMASLIVLAVAFRMTLGSLPPPPPGRADEHTLWRPSSLFLLYLLTSAFSLALTPLATLSSSLIQQLYAIGSLKYAVMFMFFATVLSTGSGVGLLLLVVAIEVISGFGSLFSGFKTVFIVLLIVALSLRMPLRLANIAVGLGTLVLLVWLGIFWTAVKPEYRDLATGYTGAQNVSASVGDRASLLIGKLFHPEEIDWGEATNQLLKRIAYIDFFGATISVAETSPEPVTFGRWRDALEHIGKPRLFFPDKAALDDTEIFVRYVRADVAEEARVGTSISIGYLAENFIDFGFPWMLFPVAALGLILGGMIRYFMTRPVAWAAGEGIATAMTLTISAGMELSIAKFLGGGIVAFVVLALCLRFLYPGASRWIRQ